MDPPISPIPPRPLAFDTEDPQLQRLGDIYGVMMVGEESNATQERMRDMMKINLAEEKAEVYILRRSNQGQSLTGGGILIRRL